MLRTGCTLKQALVDRGIGKDVYSIYENGIRQPYFSVVAKDTSVEKEQEFLQVTEEVLKKLAAEGFDEKALLAGINYSNSNTERQISVLIPRD